MNKNIVSKFYTAFKALLTRKVYIECDHIPHQFHAVPIKKILNWILVEASVFIKPEKPCGWPTHLLIEPTNRCNIKCVLCPVTEGLDRPLGLMSLDVYKKVIDDVGDYVFLILLWDWGEPFLNSKIYDMIAYAKQRNIQVISSTNGHLFTRMNQAERLVRSGIDSLIFAVDGITQHTYEHYRQGGDLAKVITSIKNVVAAKKVLNSATPVINLRFIVMKHNEHEIPKLKTFAEDIGVDMLTLRTLHPNHNENSSTNSVLANEFIPKNIDYQRFTINNENQQHRIRRKHNPCKMLWNNPAIHWDGKVCSCSFDSHGRHVLGDINKDTFRDIWYGLPYRKLRHQFRKDYQQLDLCSDCTYAFEGGSCSTEDIIETHVF